MEKKLAIHGGKPAIDFKAPDELFTWPILTQEDEDAALDVIRRNAFSGTEISIKLENEFAAWLGSKYAITFTNGTMSIMAAMYAIGLGVGDEIICPTKTYWGSVSQAANFGATAVFCNIDEHLSMDPDDLERCITPKTKAIVVVHYNAYPCDMDRIMAIAKKYNLKVIEDCSHAQGGLYKGKRLGTFGDVGAMSLMSMKSFAAGELGILVTDNREAYERAMAFGHYDRNNPKYIVETEYLKPYSFIGLGGVKARANQVCSAIARVQLKYYDERCAEIRKAMNYFWSLLSDIPAISPLCVDESTGSNMAGYYNPTAVYYPEKLGGLSVDKFCEALNKEGFWTAANANFCLHKHAFFKTFNLMHTDKPSRIAFNDRPDVIEQDDACDKSAQIYCFSAPWFKKYDKEVIEAFAGAVRKVVDNYAELLEDNDAKDAKTSGQWYGKVKF